jgi:hypothetical protein
MQHGGSVDDQNTFAVGFNTQVKAELLRRLGCGVLGVKTKG